MTYEEIYPMKCSGCIFIKSNILFPDICMKQNKRLKDAQVTCKIYKDVI